MERKIYSVSQLTRNIKSLLEEQFPFVWVNGEISNLRKATSGHFYFTLKDPNAQINAVMFSNQSLHLKFELQDGLSVNGLGRLNVYEPRGTYQVIFEYIEPYGIGTMQLAYEQLKSRLADEGLFNTQTKKKLPFLPQTICLITSPSGAVIHDMIQTALRRFPNLYIQVLPVKVQGDGADIEIAQAIELLNQLNQADLAILARGGGSLENLYPFNTEIVARAIYASTIPIISAVGHETDFTIADFVADKRASTPTAACELAIPEKKALSFRLAQLKRKLDNHMSRILFQFRNRLQLHQKRLVHPYKRIEALRIRIDESVSRMNMIMQRLLQRQTETLSWKKRTLLYYHPSRQVSHISINQKQLTEKLHIFMLELIKTKRATHKELHAKLLAFNPKAVLERGYSITRTIPDLNVLTDSIDVNQGQKLEIILAKGTLYCCVERISDHGEKNI
ncbi:MAG: exodeoxyribonuclease VII large subunit [Desulfobacterales bacterium]|nr:exodeoxyribonuclease VII large subunit [Desulfobacterales bacterium]